MPMTCPDPRIAVVIATRNRAAILRETLQRLLFLPERPQVIVVDNGSSDDTVEVARSAGSSVKLIALPGNHGAAARNLGVEAASTPYIAFADDDSWYEPCSLSLAVDLFDHHPRLGLIAARVLVGPAAELDPTCAAMARSPLPRARDLPGPAVLGFLACGAIVRRSAFLAVGGFSDRLGVGGEEKLLAIDLAVAGWQLAYIDSVVTRHHPPMRVDHQARRRTLVRNALWSAWLRRRPAGAIAETARLVRRHLFNRAGRAAIREAIAGLRSIVDARRPVPRDLDRLLYLID